MAVVYRHIRKDKNEPFYIGIGKKRGRAFSKNNRNNYWNNIVSKTEYEVEILFDNIDYDFAKEKEIEFISLYGRKDLGLGSLVNLTDGGDGCLGMVLSEETKDKISKAHLGKVFSEESRKKMSKAKKGDLAPTKQQWVKDKISKTLTGYKRGKFSKEHKLKLSKAKNKQVIHIESNKKYDSLKIACKELCLIYTTEYGRMNRNSSKKLFYWPKN